MNASVEIVPATIMDDVHAAFEEIPKRSGCEGSPHTRVCGGVVSPHDQPGVVRLMRVAMSLT